MQWLLLQLRISSRPPLRRGSWPWPQETLAVVPDVRMEKMKAIKNQLDADAYNPDGEAVAEGLIKDNMAKGRQH